MRRAGRVAGTASIAVGVLLLVWAFVVWQWSDPFTGLYTRWEQGKLESRYAELEASFPGKARQPAAARSSRPAAKPRPTPAELRADARRFRRAVGAGEPIGRIEVPRLGLDMIMVAGTDTESLKKGPGWDERTYMPGSGELVYIAGHRTTYGAPFSHIDRLRKGDLVTLTVPYGRFRYRVTRWVIVPADDLGRLRSRGSEVVALQACHPRFSARQRYIVYARPVRA